MAIKVTRITGFIGRLLEGGSSRADSGEFEHVFKTAASHDGFSVAPQGLAERIVSTARSEPRRMPVDETSSDIRRFLRHFHVVGASLASFSVGLAVAVFVFDAQSTVFVHSIMTGIAKAVTAGGYL